VAIPFVDPADIGRLTDGGAYQPGISYFRSGAVRSVTWDEKTSLLASLVDGSASRTYRCRIELHATGPTHQIVRTSCTCPLQFDCKHTVATLLAANQLSSGWQESDAATWRTLFEPATGTPAIGSPTALALGIELRQRVRRGTTSWAPVRPETATPRSLHQHGGDVLVGLRPLERSARSDAWIRGTVSWEVLRRPGGIHDAAQTRWFAELHSIGRDLRTFGVYPDVSEWLTLDDIESGLLWPHLRAAAALGIPFIPTRKNTDISLVDEASVVVHAEQRAEEIRLTPVVRLSGSAVDLEAVRPVGHSGLYRFAVVRDRIDLTLAEVPLSAPVHAMLTNRAPVSVPASDADEFVREHLPRLVRLAAVDAHGIALPAPERPTLIVTVRFSPSHRIDYSLAWRYGKRDPIAYHAVASAERDSAAEDAIGRHVEAIWADASPAPFAATGTLSGVDAAEFAARLLPQLEALGGVTVELLGDRPRYRELTADPHVAVSTVESADPDWFDLGVIVTIDGRMIPFAPLFTALTKGRKKILLSDGAYFSLAHPALARLRDLIEEAGELTEWETGPRLSRYQTALWSDFEDVADESQPAVSWRSTIESLRDVDAVPSAPLPHGLRAELRPYQRTGFDWLAFLWQHRLGGILADDMGLGKTLQMLALVAHAREAGATRPFLVVAPTSVISTWRSEAAQFTPGLRVEIVDATRAKRGITVADAAASADLVLTSYTLLRLDEAEFASVEWAGLVLDEAQFVKNPATKLHRAVKALHADATFAITGTPLENSLTDLWALLSLTAPGLFASARRFRDEYVGPIEQGKVPQNREGGSFRAARLERLRRRMRPLVLRRTKELVAADLPPKQEQVLRIELSAAHRAVYDAVLQRERQKVLGLLDDLDRNRFIVFRSLTLLRMLSLAPGLVDPAHARIPSAKLDALLDQVVELVAEGHRALVFSQFTSFLQLARERLDAAGIRTDYLDGSTRRRAEVIEGFRDGDAPVFLISLKAGGFGLTLTEADYVFLLDPWWNPAAEAQAVDRTHRIGQTRNVLVYRMVAQDTIEEKVMALQQRKARLFTAVLDDDAPFGQLLGADDIRGLFED
jgi:superfamily II DNA or RNA helicase